MNFQNLIQSLMDFWGRQGCILQQPYDVEVGAGTMHPETFLRALGPEPYRVAYIEPSRRPVDGRYGENPNRLEKHHQLQVILKPPPADIQMVYLESLTAMGIRLDEHDIKFEEDNWEWPMGGATGVGWQVMLDGQEITQFTYFQQIGGLDLMPISGEITYGLERIAMYLNDVDNVFDVPWNDDISYGEVRRRDEFEFSKYYFEIADISRYFRLFDEFEDEVRRLMAADLVLPAYENCLKCSHIFNILDARGAVSATERVQIIARVRKLLSGVARSYLDSREKAGFPLLRGARGARGAKISDE
jgi:glycyl-tRNA synthetase alpha chain